MGMTVKRVTLTSMWPTPNIHAAPRMDLTFEGMGYTHRTRMTFGEAEQFKVGETYELEVHSTVVREATA